MGGLGDVKHNSKIAQPSDLSLDKDKTITNIK